MVHTAAHNNEWLYTGLHKLMHEYGYTSLCSVAYGFTLVRVQASSSANPHTTGSLYIAARYGNTAIINIRRMKVPMCMRPYLVTTVIYGPAQIPLIRKDP